MGWLWAVVVIEGAAIVLLFAVIDSMGKGSAQSIRLLAQAHDALANEVIKVKLGLDSIERDRRGW